jgi:hypothetical protein
VWRVQLIDEHPEESSATAPIWESRGFWIAKFGIFEHRPFVSFIVVTHVLLAQHDIDSLMVSKI